MEPLYIEEVKQKTTFQIASENNHVAMCAGVWDLGLQRSEYKGEYKVKRIVLIRWEIDEEIEADGEYKGKHVTVDGYYNISYHPESNITKIIKSWLGDVPFNSTDFDFRSLPGTSCMLNIVHNVRNDITYANIAGVSKLPNKLPPITLDFDATKDPDPEFIARKRTENLESMVFKSEY